MKTIVLAGSIVANLALAAALLLKPDLAPPAWRDAFAFGRAPTVAPADAASTARMAAARTSKTKAGPKPWASLDTGDLRTLVARMREAGFPIWAIRAVVNTRVNAQYAMKRNELMSPDPNTPFWKSDPRNRMDGLYTSNLPELTRISRERSQVLKDVLGNFAYRDDGDLTSDQRRRYGNLSPDKIALIERINEDYSEMNAQVRAAMNGVTLPEDREKLALLEREQRADLAAALTPQELEDYDLRNSQTAMRLRSQLTFFNPTEDEYRTIYRLSAAYSDLLNPTAATVTDADWNRRRMQAQTDLGTQLKAALGDARYAEYVRASDPEYQRLARAAQQENVAPAAVIEAYNLRDALSRESNRIAADASMTPDAKRSALQVLAQNTRAQILGVLGPNAGPAYLRTADNWLQAVERGSVVTFNPGGGVSFRSIGAGPGTGGDITRSSGTIFLSSGGGAGSFPTSSTIIGGPNGSVTIITNSTTLSASPPPPSPAQPNPAPQPAPPPPRN